MRAIGDGRFVLGDELGRGGMGVVYRGFDTRIQREVAVKVVDAAQQSPETGARLEREALINGRLNHPNIVAVYDRNADGDEQYLVMELVHGKSLAHVAARKRPCRDEVLRWAGHVAQALAAAHRLGIVHRDIKPDNVLLDRRPHHPEVAKVCDFGIALHDGPDSVPDARPATSGWHVRGTRGYIAPEVLRGDRATPASDVYALGVVLLELFSGSLPDPVGRRLPREVPPDVAGLASALLAEDPADRPTSAAVAGELTALLAGRSSSDGVPPPRPPGRVVTAPVSDTAATATVRRGRPERPLPHQPTAPVPAGPPAALAGPRPPARTAGRGSAGTAGARPWHAAAYLGPRQVLTGAATVIPAVLGSVTWALAVGLFAATTGLDFGRAGGIEAGRIAADWTGRAVPLIVLLALPLIALPARFRPAGVAVLAVLSGVLGLGAAHGLRDAMGLGSVVRPLQDASPLVLKGPLLDYSTFWGQWVGWGGILTAVLAAVLTAGAWAVGIGLESDA
ncbi:serine/threonine-protein kinase [Streptomyces sp. NPDC002209]|uniref:serine/threonine-protein kinase n=1 Tax=Streptomyces sp. NPDC002209 TaxID=3364638 RepID=UPI00367BC31D